LGKKTSDTKQTTTSAPPDWAVPLIQGGANGVLNTYNQNQPQLNALEGQLTGSIIPGIQKQIGETKQQLQPGFNFVNGTLGGQYLNSNPYTTAMANQAGQAAGNAVNSAFSLAGRTGSDNHATDLARGVDQAQNQVLFQNYQNERGLQNQALGALPGMTAAQYQGYTPLLGATQLGGQLPYYGSNSLSNLGSLLGNYGTSTSNGTQPGGWLNGLLSAGASLGSAAIMASDRRLKTNIEKVGEASDGLGVYEWNWKADPQGPTVRGVIADEVEKLRPWAFVPNFRNGYAGVNYGTLGSLA
jgi:hypothetical protein